MGRRGSVVGRKFDWIAEGSGVMDGAAAPSPPSPFLGRRRELTAVDAALKPGACVVLAAEGARLGTGTSALAWEVVRRASGFAGGVLWWSLDRDGSRAPRAMHRWARQVGAPSPEDGTRAAMEAALEQGLAAHHASQGTMLVVVDGVRGEHVDVVLSLLDLLPEGTTRLITADDAEAAAAFDGTRLVVGPMPAVDSLGLLRSQARSRLPQNAAVAAMNEVAGLPLGVRFVARRHGYAPPDDLSALTELPDDLMLEAWSVDRLEGLAAMARLFFVLYRGLDVRAQRTVRWAAVLRTAVLRPIHVAGLLLAHEDEVRQDLEDAGYRGILEIGAAEGTWHLHPLVRRWLSTLIEEAGEGSEIRERHLAYFVGLAQELARRDAASDEVLELADDLIMAGETARQLDEQAALVALAESLALPDGALVRAGFLSESVDLVASALEVARQSQPGAVDGLVAAMGELASGATSGGGRSAASEARTADLELARAEGMLAITDASLEMERPLAQVLVWVEAGQVDAAGHTRPAVLEKLAELEKLGVAAQASIDAVLMSVEEAATAMSARGVQRLVTAAEAARDQMEAWAESSEALWTSLNEVLSEVDSDAARVDALVEQGRREAVSATEFLDETRARIKGLRSDLPPTMTVATSDTWKGVSTALAAAMEALRGIELAAEEAGLGGLEQAREGLDRVHGFRAELETACEQALEAAAETVRVSQMASEQQASLSEAASHAQRAREVAGRFIQNRDAVRSLLGGLVEEAEAAALLERIEALDAEVGVRVGVAVSCADGVRRATSEPERRRVLRQAKKAASEVSRFAVEATGIRKDAEDLAEDLREHLEERHLRAAQHEAREHLDSIDVGVGVVWRRLEKLRASSEGIRASAVSRPVGNLKALETALRGTADAARDALREVSRAKVASEAKEALAAASRLVQATHEEQESMGRALETAEQALRDHLDAELSGYRAQARAQLATSESAREAARESYEAIRELSQEIPSDTFSEIADAAKGALERADVGVQMARDALERAEDEVELKLMSQWLDAASAGATEANGAADTAAEVLTRATTIVADWKALREAQAERREQLMSEVDQLTSAWEAATGEHESARETMEDSPDDEVSTLVLGMSSDLEDVSAAIEAAVDGLEAFDALLSEEALTEADALVMKAIQRGLDILETLPTRRAAARERHEAALVWAARQASLRQVAADATQGVHAEMAVYTSAIERIDDPDSVSIGGEARQAFRSILDGADSVRDALARVDETAAALVESVHAEAADEVMSKLELEVEAFYGLISAGLEAVGVGEALAERWMMHRDASQELVREEAAALVERFRHAEQDVATATTSLEMYGEGDVPVYLARAADGLAEVEQCVAAVEEAKAQYDGAETLEMSEAAVSSLQDASSMGQAAVDTVVAAVAKARETAEKEAEMRRREAESRRPEIVGEVEALHVAWLARVDGLEAELASSWPQERGACPDDMQEALAHGEQVLEGLRTWGERLGGQHAALTPDVDGDVLLQTLAVARRTSTEAEEATEAFGAVRAEVDAALARWESATLRDAAAQITELLVAVGSGEGLAVASLDAVRDTRDAWDDARVDEDWRNWELAVAAWPMMQQLGLGLQSWLDGRGRLAEAPHYEEMLACYVGEVQALVADAADASSRVSTWLQTFLEELQDATRSRREVLGDLAASLEEELSALRDGFDARVAGWVEDEVQRAAGELRSCLDVFGTCQGLLAIAPVVGGHETRDDLLRLGTLQEDAWSAVEGAARDAREASCRLDDAIEVAAAARVARYLAAVEAMQTEGAAAHQAVRMVLDAGRHESLGLEDDPEVQRVIRTLESQEESAEDLLAKLRDELSVADVALGHEALRELVLVGAGQVGALLSVAIQVRQELEEMRQALTSAVMGQLEAAREGVERILDAALDVETDTTDRLGDARATAALWHADMRVVAALTHLDRSAEAVFSTVEKIQGAAALVGRTASLYQAKSLAVDAAERLEELPALREAFGVAIEALSVECDAALVRLHERVTTQAQDVRDAASAAMESVVQIHSSGLALVEQWTIASVVRTATALEARVTAQSKVLAAAEEAAQLAEAAESREDVLAALEWVEEAQTNSLLGEGAAQEALQALRVMLLERLGDQLEIFADEAAGWVSEADEAMVLAVIARATAEDLTSAHEEASIQDALARLVGVAESAERQAEVGRKTQAGMSELPSVAAGREALDVVRDARDETLELSRTAESLLTEVEALVTAREALDASIAAAQARFGGEFGESQIAFDELELTLEATRDEFVETSEEVQARWSSLEATLADVRDGLRMLASDASGAANGLTQDEVEPVFDSLCDRALKLGAQCREALDALPVLMDEHAKFTKDTREKLRARLTIRLSSARSRAVCRQAVGARRRAHEVVTVDARYRVSWQGIHGLYEALEQRLQELHELQAMVDEAMVEDAVTMSVRSEVLAAEMESLGERLVGLSVVMQQEALTTRRMESRARRQQRYERLEAAVADQQEAGRLLGRIRAWRRAVGQWADGWHERPVQDAVAEFEVAAAHCEALARQVRVAVLPVFEAHDESKLDARAVLLSDRVSVMGDSEGRVRDAVDGVARAVRLCRDGRQADREQALAERAEQEEVTARLEAVLGRGDAARRIPLFEKGLAVARLRGDDQTLVGWMVDTADLYIEVGRGDDARALLEEVVTRTDDDSHLVVARVMLRLSRMALASGDAAGALTLCQRGMNAARACKDRRLQQALLRVLGSVGFAQGDMDAAISAHEQALALAEAEAEHHEMAIHLSSLSRAYQRRDELELALSLSRRAAATYQVLGHVAGLAAELGRQSLMLRQQGQLDAALGCGREALKAAEASGDSAVLMVQRGILGQVWLALKRPWMAKRWFDAAADLLDADDQEGRAWVMANQAAVHRALSRGRTTLSAPQALAASKDMRRRARRRDRSGRVSCRDPRTSYQRHAATLYREAAELAASQGDSLSQGRRLLNLGAVLAESGAKTEAAEILSTAEASLREVQSSDADKALALRQELTG